MPAFDKKYNSIKTKIILSIFLVIVIFGIATALFVYYIAEKAFVDQKKMDLKYATVEQTHETAQQFFAAQRMAKSIAESEQSIKFLEGDLSNTSKSDLLIMMNHSNTDKTFGVLYLTDIKGEIVVATENYLEGNNHAYREYFKKTIAGIAWVEYAKNDITGIPGYFFSHPVVGQDGEVIGVAVTKLEPPSVESAFLETPLQLEGALMFVTKEGLVIYDSEKDRKYKTLGDISPVDEKKLKEEKNIQLADIPKLDYAEIQIYLQNYQGPKVFDFLDKLDNEQEIVSVSQIGKYPFFIIAEMKKSSFVAPMIKISIIVGVAVLLSAIFCSILMIVITNEFLKPLEKLKEFAKEMSKGNFNERINLQTNDEFAELGNVFNLMAARLKSIYGKLDQKVLEKTRDLQKFQLAIDNASDHIVITDEKGVLIYANHTAETITEFSFAEMKGKTPRLWGGQMTKAFYKKMWKTIKDEKQTFIGNLTNVRKGGERYEAEIKISPIVDKNGVVKFFVGIERDITRAREVDRAKTEFVSLASHQLRTPLTAIKWHIEMLIDEDMGKLKAAQKESLQEVYHSNERMIDLVNSLLNTSRIDMGTFAIDPVKTDVVQLIDDIIREMEQLLKIKKIKIQKTYGNTLPKINVDQMLLRIVLQNLLSNAIKYTPNLGKIKISIQQREKDTLFSVSDTGYGIPKKQQRKIFSKLFRADNAKELDADGSGLGLYVTKAVVEQAGGQIWFVSQEKKGTTFYFTILRQGMKKKKGAKALSQMPL